MQRKHLAVAAVSVAGIIAAACGGGGSDDDDAGAAAPPAREERPAAVVEATATFAGAGLVTGSGGFDWNVSRVDQGTKPGIVIDANGQALIAYLLERRGSAGFVRVAAATADGFQTETLQDGYLYGPLDIALSADGTAAVAYHNHDWEDAAVAVRGADGTWSVDRIRDSGHDGWDTSLAFGPNNSLYVLGVDPVQFGSANGVEFATRQNGEWTVAPVGSGPQPYEWGTDIAVRASATGREVHSVFFDAAGQDLIYGLDEGAGWTLSPIFTDGDAGRFAVLALDATGLPHVAFFQTNATVNDEGNAAGAVMYGSFDGSAWSFEAVGRMEKHILGFEGARRTVALSFSQGEPVIAFVDEAALSLATRLNGAWQVETLLEVADDPFQVVGLAVDADGAPHLTFSTITANGPLDGEVWYVAPVAKS